MSEGPQESALDDLLAYAEGYAEFSMRKLGRVPPSLLANSPKGSIHFIPAIVTKLFFEVVTNNGGERGHFEDISVFNRHPRRHGGRGKEHDEKGCHDDRTHDDSRTLHGRK
jgi:hypothetical protein